MGARKGGVSKQSSDRDLRLCPRRGMEPAESRMEDSQLIIFVTPAAHSEVCFVRLIDFEGRELTRPIAESFLAFRSVNFDLLSQHRAELIKHAACHPGRGGKGG